VTAMGTSVASALERGIALEYSAQEALRERKTTKALRLMSRALECYRQNISLYSKVFRGVWSAEPDIDHVLSNLTVDPKGKIGWL